jgi:hypothetical protein
MPVYTATYTRAFTGTLVRRGEGEAGHETCTATKRRSLSATTLLVPRRTFLLLYSRAHLSKLDFLVCAPWTIKGRAHNVTMDPHRDSESIQLIMDTYYDHEPLQPLCYCVLLANQVIPRPPHLRVGVVAFCHLTRRIFSPTVTLRG